MIDGRSLNFAVLRPRRTALNVDIRLAQSDELDTAIASSNIDILEYDKRWGAYRIKLTKKDIDDHKDLIAELLQKALEERKRG